MSFDPVNDKTHALALKQIVGEAMGDALDKHNEDKHTPHDTVHTNLDKEVTKQKNFRIEVRAIGATIAAGMGGAWAWLEGLFGGPVH